MSISEFFLALICAKMWVSDVQSSPVSAFLSPRSADLSLVRAKTSISGAKYPCRLCKNECAGNQNNIHKCQIATDKWQKSTSGFEIISILCKTVYLRPNFFILKCEKSTCLCQKNYVLCENFCLELQFTVHYFFYQGLRDTSEGGEGGREEQASQFPTSLIGADYIFIFYLLSCARNSSKSMSRSILPLSFLKLLRFIFRCPSIDGKKL